MSETRFFANFANGGLFSGFAVFDMAFGDGPAIFRVLNEEDFDILLVGSEPENNPAGGRFADNLLDGRAFTKNFGTELGERRFLIVLRGQGLGDFAPTSRGISSPLLARY